MRLGSQIWFLLFSLSISGQVWIKTSQYSTEDGLPQNSVNQILQDNEGYIWVATQDGLARFNGYEFEIYRPDVEDSFSISDNFIIQVVEDRFGKLWISTRDGLNILERESGKFFKVHNKFDIGWNQPSTIRYHNQHMYFVNMAENHMQFYKVADDYPFSKANNDVLEVGSPVPGPDGRLVKALFPINNDVVITARDMIYRISGSDTISEKMTQDIAFLSAETWDYSFDDAKLVFGQMDKIISVNLSTLDVSEHPFPYRILSIRKNDNQYFVGTTNGVYIGDNDLRKWDPLLSFEQDFNNLIIHNIYIDKDGRIWIGTANRGLFVYHPNQQEFNYTIPSNINENFENHVWDASFNDGTLLIGTNRGLIQQDTRHGTYSNLLLPDYRIKSVLVDSQGNEWAGTAENGLFRKEKGGEFQSVMNYTSAFSKLLEHNGEIWIGSYKGLFKSTAGGKIVSHDLGVIPASYILSLYFDQLGRLWVGHNLGLGIYSFEDRKSINIPYKKGDPRSPNFNFISGFAEVDGTMYVATYGGGLSRLNKDSTFTHFTEKNGLSNNIIHAMTADGKGKIWMTSNGGISVFDPKTESFSNFTTASGLLSHNFSISSIDTSIPGHLMVGTVDGLLTFRPDMIRTVYPSPEIKVDHVEINYSKTDLHRKMGKEPLVLDSNDKVLTVYFSALNYSDPNDVQYRFQLEGFDENWVDAQAHQRSLVYSSLPAGDFELNLMASSKNNLFEPTVSRFSVTVLPPFWMNPLFYVPVILLFITLVIISVYYLSRRKLQKRVRELETKEKVQQERERISRDLHDSVGTHFAYIVSRLDFLHLGWEKNAISDKRDYLGNLADFARSGMRMLRETIWALNEENVDSISLRAKIDDYLKLCFRNESIHYQLNFKSERKSIKASNALNTFRIIQEAVSNSMKHAHATDIIIDIYIKDKVINLEIRDDGVGFDIDEAQKKDDHFGLTNLEKRAKEINAKLEIASSKTGTVISVVGIH